MIQLQATMVSAVLAMQRIFAAGSMVLQSLQPIRTRWQVFCGQFQHNLTHPPDPESIRNHHVAGVAVIGLAVISFLEESKGEKAGWIRYIWPGMMFVMGIAIIGWADPGTWPDGPKPLVQDIEAIQHKFFALFAMSLGAIELFRRLGKLTHKAWGYVFSVTMIGAGVFCSSTRESTRTLSTCSIWRWDRWESPWDSRKQPTMASKSRVGCACTFTACAF